jgi:hypothetical protein
LLKLAREGQPVDAGGAPFHSLSRLDCCCD